MKVAAIIPAYNEEKTIVNVLKAAKDCKFLDEIIVVDDGSSDRTSILAEEAGAKIVKNEENLGKGKALDVGVKKTKADILLFLDADLINFKTEHINSLLSPVLKNNYDMSVGAIDRRQIGNFLNKIFQKTESPFSGMRAIKRSFWFQIPEKYKKDFYVESTITYLAKKRNLRVLPLVLDGVRHVTKENKRGFWIGTKDRWKMNFQIVFINIALRLHLKTKNGFPN
jgi:polyisoprenyl-phosphate glycosyltransferase